MSRGIYIMIQFCYVCLTLLVLLVFWLAPRNEYSEPMTEIGEVYESVFLPDGFSHHLASGFSFGQGGGTTLTPINVNIPARYAVVFKWRHGKFVIDDDNAQSLYENLDRGDKVLISYREIKHKVKGKMTVVGYDFLEAVKISE